MDADYSGVWWCRIADPRVNSGRETTLELALNFPGSPDPSFLPLFSPGVRRFFDVDRALEKMKAPVRCF